MEKFFTGPAWYRDVALIGVEVAIVVLVFVIVGLALRLIFRRLEKSPALEKHRAVAKTIRRNVSVILALIATVLVLGVIGLNGYLIYRKHEIYAETAERLGQLTPQFWINIALSIGKIIGLVIVATLVVRFFRKLLMRLREWAKGADQIKANDESIEAFFGALNRIQTNSIWLLVLALAAAWLPFPPVLSAYLFIALRVYLIIAIGLLVVKAVAAIVESLDALSARFASPDNFLRFYHHMRGLVPLLRRCLEYIIYACVATLVMLQVDFIAPLATWGPRVIQVIGIFFLSRVVVEISNLLVDKAYSGPTELTELEQQQRATLIPLIKSFLRGVIYFGAFVLMLSALGFNPLPLLAGAGIVGIVVGFGAQPVINDLVSGFFILFENLYLVGDYIEVGSARGTVEAIQLRTTRIRDPSGQMHILRNGQLTGVVNYSKSYTFAVVDVGVDYSSNLDRVYELLREVGRQLKEAHSSVLEPTDVRGLENFGPSELVIRTVTRVKPGMHNQVARDLRKLIKEAFEREGIEIPYPHQVTVTRGSSREERREV